MSGPHSSSTANKLDPRVDSDLDHRANPSSVAPGSTTTGTTTSGSNINTTGTASNAGPHQSNLANKLDPRVDSDRDHRANQYSTVPSSGATTYPSSTGGAAGTGQGTVGSGDPTSTGSTNYRTHGPGTTGDVVGSGDPTITGSTAHKTHGSGTTGGVVGSGGPTSTGSTAHKTHGSGTTGGVVGSGDPTSTGSTAHKTHGSGTTGGVAGSGDPTTAAYGSKQGQGASTLPGSGNAPTTAGPHNSDLLNKLDPRVDSDLDGSKTLGGNATYR